MDFRAFILVSNCKSSNLMHNQVFLLRFCKLGPSQLLMQVFRCQKNCRERRWKAEKTFKQYQMLDTLKKLDVLYLLCKAQLIPTFNVQGSLVPETLKEMETDVDFQRTRQALLERGQAALTAEERKKRRRALDNLGVPSFDQFLIEKVSCIDLQEVYDST